MGKRKKQVSRKTLVYSSSEESLGISHKYIGKRSYFTCTVHETRLNGFKETTDIIPKCKLRLDEMIEIIRIQARDNISGESTRIHFKIYAQDSRA